MKIYHELEQGSTEWHELRHGKIGGTRSKQITVKTDTLLIEILAELTEPFDEDVEQYKSDAMENGSNLEPQARLELTKYTGVEFLEVGWIQSDDELLGVSPDGISPCATIGCEIKCPEAKEHIRTCLADEIPLKHIDQCIHNFMVNTELKEFYFMSYRPESVKPIFVKKLTRDSLVNVGTEAKPVFKTIAEQIEINRACVELLKIKITESLNKLKF
jgi:hypothetical protein